MIAALFYLPPSQLNFVILPYSFMQSAQIALKTCVYPNLVAIALLSILDQNVINNSKCSNSTVKPR